MPLKLQTVPCEQIYGGDNLFQSRSWGQFKSGFGGTVLRRRGCWAFPYDRRLYEQLRGAELRRERFHCVL